MTSVNSEESAIQVGIHLSEEVARSEIKSRLGVTPKTIINYLEEQYFIVEDIRFNYALGGHEIKLQNIKNGNLVDTAFVQTGWGFAISDNGEIGINPYGGTGDGKWGLTVSYANGSSGTIELESYVNGSIAISPSNKYVYTGNSIVDIQSGQLTKMQDVPIDASGIRHAFMHEDQEYFALLETKYDKAGSEEYAMVSYRNTLILHDANGNLVGSYVVPDIGKIEGIKTFASDIYLYGTASGGSRGASAYDPYSPGDMSDIAAQAVIYKFDLSTLSLEATLKKDFFVNYESVIDIDVDKHGLYALVNGKTKNNLRNQGVIYLDNGSGNVSFLDTSPEDVAPKDIMFSGFWGARIFATDEKYYIWGSDNGQNNSHGSYISSRRLIVNRGEIGTQPTPNNLPDGTPKLHGEFKVGQTISIDASAIEDIDNFKDWTPAFEYSWEVSGDNGTTWTSLANADATDGDDSYTLASSEVGKRLRGVVSYLDGYGTNEVVASESSLIQYSSLINNVPSGDLIIDGITRSGQTITVDSSSIHDKDDINTPFTFGWEVRKLDSNEWLELTSTDALDGDADLLLIPEFVGQELRGRASYVDGNGLTEVITSELVTIQMPLSIDPEGPKTQTVYTALDTIAYAPGADLEIPLLYDTGNRDPNLSGLSLNVHFDSSVLTPIGNGVSNQWVADITSATIFDDSSDLDGNPLTDKLIELSWASFDSSFPSVGLPISIATLQFLTNKQKVDPITGENLQTSITTTGTYPAENFSFLSRTSTLEATPFSLDVDASGSVSPLGDGLMVIRKLFGNAFTGEALTHKAQNENSPWSTEQIHDFIDFGINSGVLDVDRDGRTTALGDGLMIIRRLFGPAFAGEALISKAINPDSPYYGEDNAWEMVAANIDALNPYL